MKELTEKLWPAFLAEVTEHLESLELALVGRAATDIADINAIFRSFHTIKGGCAMMGFGSMEAVAHASEDLLDPLRKGQRPLTDALVTLLLEVLDCLKAQLAESAASKQAPSPAPELLARLHAARDGAAPETPAKPERRGSRGSRSQDKAASTPAPVVHADTNTPAGNGGAIDAATATGFAGTARALLPAIVAALAGGSAAAAAAANKDLAQLADAARGAGIVAVARLLARLATQADGDERLALLADVVDRIAYVETATGLDCGVAAAGANGRAALGDAFHAALRDLLAQIGTLSAAGSPATAQAAVPVRNAATAAVAGCDRAVNLALLLRLTETVALLRTMTQVLRELARGGVEPANELNEFLELAAAIPAEIGPGQAEDAAYQAMCAQLRENLQRAAANRVHGNDAAGRSARIRRRIDIAAEVLDTLTAGALDLLEAAIDRDETIVEIEADLEATPDFGQEFVGWLSRNGTLVSNHTVFHRETAGGIHTETTRLRFVAALRVSPEEARLMLGDLDPQRRYFDLRHCVRLDAAEAPATAAQPAREAAAAPVAATPAAAATASTLRIDSGALDRFVDRVGEMVMLRNMQTHALHRDDLAMRLRQARTLLNRDGAAAGADRAWLLALLADLEAQQDQLSQADVRMLGALGRMQEDVLALRVVPIGMVFNRLPRTVRDLGHAQGKTISLDLQGEDVRIDKGMVDLLVEPLMHMVRNAVDHGIESPAERDRAGKPATATLSLSARQQGNTLLIEVADDGRGLDYERIRRKAVASGVAGEAEVAGMGERELANLIFMPGFSTAERVTEVSGRGVGMDVVKTRIAQIGGQIDIRSTAGRGTSFLLRLPLSVAIQSVVHVDCGNRQLAIPDRNVLEILSIPADSLQSVQG